MSIENAPGYGSPDDEVMGAIEPEQRRYWGRLGDQIIKPSKVVDEKDSTVRKKRVVRKRDTRWLDANFPPGYESSEPDVDW